MASFCVGGGETGKFFSLSLLLAWISVALDGEGASLK
jgi:hypothetical protein